MAKYKKEDFVSEWYRINDRELPLICEALDLLLETETLNDHETYVADELRADLINSKTDSIEMKKLLKKWQNGSI
tara:strand:- start:4269 stop:4493 length:225 start_codon:yes stop_codon:yes gene_type:complete